MSVFSRRDLGDTPNQLVPIRQRTIGNVSVSPDTAMRSSAVWSCLQLRSDIVSTLPLNAYRKVAGVDVMMDTPPPLVANPANDAYGIEDWLGQTQMDIDRLGNTVGVIQSFDRHGYARQVEPVQMATVRIQGKGARITGFRIDGTLYKPSEIWHERQNVLPGIPLGLSPISFGAYSIGAYLSAQQFGLDWFGNGTIPSGTLKNTAKKLNPDEAQIVKSRFKAAVTGRDVFVTGSDWEFDPMQVAANESQFLETMEMGTRDIARFMGVPADLIDASTGKANITYANITQRNLQFLVLKMQPVLTRRERAFTLRLPSPQFAKFDTSQFLRMDPASMATMLAEMVTARLMTPSEARAALNLMPYTPAQIAEFNAVFGSLTPEPSLVTPSEDANA